MPSSRRIPLDTRGPAGPLAGLYLHVPFCVRICPYCDFAVRTGDRERRRAFVEHLLAEIDLHADSSLEFDTIYFGGGTPSCLEPEDLARIVHRAQARLHTAAHTRIFLEANPEDVSPESVAAWRQLGVDTLSLGIQALNRKGLEFLGRLHDPESAERSVTLSREAGFRTVSMDLIYGLPGQSAADWKDELDRALALQPDHISCYQLTVHAGTRFGAREKRGTLTQLSSDAQGELFHLTWLMHLAGSALVLVWALWVCAMPLLDYLVFFAYPGLSLTLLRSFLEHQARPETGARSVLVEAGWPVALMFLNNNLHALHHAEPGLAWYKMPARYHERREELLAGNGGYRYGGYLEIAARYLFKPKEHPRYPLTAAG